MNRPLTPLRAVILVALALLGFWLSRQEQQPQPHGESRAPRSGVEPQVDQRLETPVEAPAEPAPSRSQFPNVSVRDLDGEVVFRGTIDVQPTLDRIAAGRRLDYRNDGSTFQNRERRLPAKPGGYYKEFVHPTPSLSGPGPQRIVVGAKGEAYYTPDHYRTFHRIR
jgi:guanyl-specific ribonuclease Sa